MTNENFVEGFDPDVFSIRVKIKKPKIRRSQILKAINCKYLTLEDCDGYFLWVYDSYLDEYGNDNPNEIYETLSTYSYKLNHMDFDRWVEIGKNFVKECEAL